MTRALAYFALATLIGLTGCAYYEEPITLQPVPAQSVLQPQAPMTIEGQVVRMERNAYIVREPSGLETRVFFDRNTLQDTIAVGDYVVVRFEGPPANTYAASITRRIVNPVPPAPLLPPPVVNNILPRPQTIVGTVEEQYGNEYEIRDISGRDVRLRTDRTTNRDSNITVGDKVTAIVNAMPFDSYYVYRLGNPNIIQGEIMRIDDERYIIRDALGREIRIRMDDANRYSSPLRVGDRVVVLTGKMPYDPPYYVYRLGDPGAFQGEIVRIEGTCYVVRDITGREICLYTNSTTVWNDPIIIGDRIVVYPGPASVLHADFIAKR